MLCKNLPPGFKVGITSKMNLFRSNKRISKGENQYEKS